jgi:aspartyl-tRNA(Asn)/glutamyl-tRNA(Gln) amidotransferase subunit A
MDPVTSRRAFLGAGAALAAAAPTATAAGRRPRRTRSAVALLPDPDRVAALGRQPADLGVLEAASLLQARRLRATELLEACLARIDRRDPSQTFDGAPDAINALVRRYDDVARAAAARADARLSAAGVRRAGRRAPLLTGVPIVLKDLYAVAGLPLTASSRILTGNVARGDSTVWRRLAAAGMVLVGHAHTDEFAFLASTPQCGNPWDTRRSTGGSSGGSAAALAARLVPAATGSDTLGSLRVPAAFCGVSSIKPTFGLVPTTGVIPLAWALDHCGPMARSVGDCALLLSAMAGPDGGDPSTDVRHVAPARYPLRARRGPRPLDGVRLGVPRRLGGPTAPQVAQVVERVQGELRGLGATLVAVDEPDDPFAQSTVAIELYTDALSYHAPWFPAQAAAYRPPAAQMLAAIAARRLSALDYLDLHRRRGAYQAAYRDLLARERLDAVLLPVARDDPPRRDDPRGLSPLTDPRNATLETFRQACLGFPCVTIAGGRSAATGLPVGLQLVGAPFTEARLVQLAIDWETRHPRFEEQPEGLA